MSSNCEQRPTTEKKSKEEILAEREAKRLAKKAGKKNIDGKKDKKDLDVKQNVKESNHPKPKQTVSTSSAKVSTSSRIPVDIKADNVRVEKKLRKSLASAHIPSFEKSKRQVQLFSHLHQYDRRKESVSSKLPLLNGPIPSVFVKLGLQYASRQITGSNARCIALLSTLKQMINSMNIDEVETPSSSFIRELDSQLKPVLSFLRQCRTLSISMSNAIRHFKSRLTHHQSSELDINDQKSVDIKHTLISDLDEYISENIVLASQQICLSIVDKICIHDTIVIYGFSSFLVWEDAIKALHDKFSQNFGRHEEKESKNNSLLEIIVFDCRPYHDGMNMLIKLQKRFQHSNFTFTYADISMLSYLMSKASKVFLGAEAVFANGAVFTAIGSAQICLMAKANLVPVFIFCETYKFTERVQTDSFVFNELGDPEDLLFKRDGEQDTETNFTPLNLYYDVTPSHLIDGIVTELSIIPTTSVPVIIRFKSARL